MPMPLHHKENSMAEGNKPYKTKADTKVKKTKNTAKAMERKQSARGNYADSNTGMSKFKSKANVPKG